MWALHAHGALTYMQANTYTHKITNKSLKVVGFFFRLMERTVFLKVSIFQTVIEVNDTKHSKISFNQDIPLNTHCLLWDVLWS